MSCKIKEMSFERNCGKQSWYVFGISTLRQKIVQPACIDKLSDKPSMFHACTPHIKHFSLQQGRCNLTPAIFKPLKHTNTVKFDGTLHSAADPTYTDSSSAHFIFHTYEYQQHKFLQTKFIESRTATYSYL